jgi:peptidoglycan-associated lipoprotein
MTFKKIILLTSLSAFLVACGSKVPLTEPAKVEDRTGRATGLAPVNPTTNTGNSINNNSNNASVSPRDVKPVETNTDQNAKLDNVVYFDFDSYVVKPEAQSLLAGHAKRLAADRNAKVSLAGHTDDLGGREYNLALGQKRADAVKRALGILGVTDAQMESVSYGKEKAANAGTDDAARAANRRVEIAAR